MPPPRRPRHQRPPALLAAAAAAATAAAVGGEGYDPEVARRGGAGEAAAVRSLGQIVVKDYQMVVKQWPYGERTAAGGRAPGSGGSPGADGSVRVIPSESVKPSQALGYLLTERQHVFGQAGGKKGSNGDRSGKKVVKKGVERPRAIALLAF